MPRVFFYGRRPTPRNMFSLGIDALRVAAQTLSIDDIEAEFVMAGEDGADVDLGHGFVVRNLGVLDRPTYFDAIASVDVGLTLQATAHPSHMPFDLGMSGAIAGA